MRENKSVHYDLDPEVHTNLGYVYKKLGKYDLAIKSFQKAIDIDLEYVSAYNGLGSVYSIQDKIEEIKALCAEYIRKAISLDVEAGVIIKRFYEDYYNEK